MKKPASLHKEAGFYSEHFTDGMVAYQDVSEIFGRMTDSFAKISGKIFRALKSKLFRYLSYGYFVLS